MAKMHHMTAKYGGLQGDFALTLLRFRDQTLADMDEIFRQVMIRIGSTVIRLSPVDTGAFRGSWTFTIDQPSSETPTRLDKEGHETIARLVADVQHLSFGQTAYLVSNLPYGIPLEYGHSTQAPGGFVRITLARFNQIVEDAIKQVTA